jgi:Na+-translocating ferredoxin:NAD+ oxidoreductase RnfC subunit
MVIVAVAAVIAAAAYTTTNSFQTTHAVVGRFVPQAKAPMTTSVIMCMLPMLFSKHLFQSRSFSIVL